MLKHFPQLAQLYRNTRDQWDRNQPAWETKWGFKLAGHETMASGTFEPQETRLVRDLLEGIDIFVNVGANVGYYCCHALSMGKPVIAVEPVVRNLHYLMRNIVENGWERQVEIFPLAVGARSDILKMWGGGTGASLIKGWSGVPSSYVTQVPVLTLDRILGNSLRGKRALILVDVEGAEYDMLQGAVASLASEPRPIWIIEIVALSHQPEGVKVNPYLVPTFEFFFNHGYMAKSTNSVHDVIGLDMVRSVANGQGELSSANFLFTAHQSQ